MFSPTEEFIALLGNLSLLQLIFASWNINASLSMTHSGMSFVNVPHGQKRRVTMELYNSTFNSYLHYSGKLHAPLFSCVVGSSFYLLTLSFEFLWDEQSTGRFRLG